MTVARLFTYWIGTVLIGSVIGPLTLTIFAGGGGDLLIEVIFICILASMSCSLPSMLVFYLVLTYQIDHKIQDAQKKRTLMWTHLTCGFITFFILNMLIGNGLVPAIIAFFVIYTGIGMLYWHYEFKKDRQSSEAKEEEEEEETDRQF